MTGFRFILTASVAAIAVAPGAFAQSTGSIDFDQEIVVKGRAGDRAVAGVVAPDTSKAKAVLTQEFIERQVPGQTINDTINQLPGVSFQNNDPFGSAGGKLYIRGFDNTRISQTFDGVPLNDSGGYALYSNQQLDPELIEQVNVNLGSTDVDSPTAAATGSTVNYRTRNPGEEFGVKAAGSFGDFSFFRVFGMVDTGTLTSFGTRAFIAASRATNDTVYGPGKIDKQQYNAKVYQPLGSGGDFISIAGHYNQNRNNFFGSVPLRSDVTQAPGNSAPRVAGPESSNRTPLTKDERFYEIAPCVIPGGVAGVADAVSGCGSSFDYRYNPSNTGNIRVNSRFTLADGLVLTVDPSYQYVKANGGGTGTASEKTTTIGGTAYTGYVGGTYYTGTDLNGDGDKLDSVRVLTPSQTQTHRFGVISSLRYDISGNQSIRLAYSLDHARHRQTGEIGFLKINGYGKQYFPINDPILGTNGLPLQKRDRLSYAILNQIAGEYRGKFFDVLTLTAGIRAPFFKRDLNNYCFTTAANGNVDCFGGGGDTTPGDTANAAAKPTVQGPQQRVFKYDRILPNVGFVFNAAGALDLFGNYSKGMQVPGTDNLYQSFYYDRSNPNANPTPETSDNFDLGARYRAGRLQAQASVWYTSFKNRLASAYDRDLSQTIYRNLGAVTKYGIDGSIAYRPINELSFYVFGSYIRSKIKDDIDAGTTCSAAHVAIGMLGCTKAGDIAYFQTKGKRESGAPVYTFGGRVQGSLGPVELGVQVKRTGHRYVNDQNLPVIAIDSTGATPKPYAVYGAKAPGYTLVDLDARVSLEPLGLNDKTYLQFNVSNLFDKLYVGGFDGGTTSQTSVIFANMGAPRTFIGSFVIGF